MTFHVQDALWSPLRSFVLSIPPSRLRYFPAVTGSTWFFTLAALLLTWLGRGMPRYPGQSNPDVAFISDIASFELKPLFLVGATMTAAGYAVTISAVHVVRYEPCYPEDHPSLFNPATEEVDYSDDRNEYESRSDNSTDGDAEEEEEEEEDESMARTLRLVSLISISAAAVAGSALILLAVMDTVHYRRAHTVLLQICFASLVIQSTGTVTLYARDALGLFTHAYRRENPHRPTWKPKSFRVSLWILRCLQLIGLSGSASLSIVIILFEIGLGIAFIVLLVPGEERFREAVILEWIIAFMGTLYLWLFGGFLDRHSARIVLK